MWMLRSQWSLVFASLFLRNDPAMDLNNNPVFANKWANS